MIRKTVYTYKSRTGELVYMDSVDLNTKDAKWWMKRYGIEDVNLGKHENRVSKKRKRGNFMTEVEFTWLNSLEKL